MKSIQALVSAKLEAQAGLEGAVGLWARLWAAYEEGGNEAAEAFLASLLGPSTGASAVEGAGS